MCTSEGVAQRRDSSRAAQYNSFIRSLGHNPNSARKSRQICGVGLYVVPSTAVQNGDSSILSRARPGPETQLETQFKQICTCIAPQQCPQVTEAQRNKYAPSRKAKVRRRSRVRPRRRAAPCGTNIMLERMVMMIITMRSPPTWPTPAALVGRQSADASPDPVVPWAGTNRARGMGPVPDYPAARAGAVSLLRAPISAATTTTHPPLAHAPARSFLRSLTRAASPPPDQSNREANVGDHRGVDRKEKMPRRTPRCTAPRHAALSGTDRPACGPGALCQGAVRRSVTHGSRGRDCPVAAPACARVQRLCATCSAPRCRGPRKTSRDSVRWTRTSVVQPLLVYPRAQPPP
eukprot:scaffold910_cov396-Prasinococcus_capsulatus_cf.AAC.28